MKINNKPMSALPSVADTPADTGRSCVRLFGLYTILPKVLRVVVEVLFLYHLITGFYHLEPFLRFGKHVRETASFQQKGPPLTEWPSIIVELRGFEPLTLSMPWRCATSCAIAPKLPCKLCIIYIADISHANFGVSPALRNWHE